MSIFDLLKQPSCTLESVAAWVAEHDMADLNNFDEEGSSVLDVMIETRPNFSEEDFLIFRFFLDSGVGERIMQDTLQIYPLEDDYNPNNEPFLNHKIKELLECYLQK